MNTGTELRRHAALALYWAILLLAAIHGLEASAEPKTKAKTRVHKVMIEAMKYSPETIEAAPGDTVVWINKDPFPHTVTSSGAANHAFDSGEIAPNRSWKLMVRDKGQFSYVCTLHPTMKASLVVK